METGSWGDKNSVTEYSNVMLMHNQLRPSFVFLSKANGL